MGTNEFRVYGKLKFEKEQQFSHICLLIEAFSESDALEKAKKISGVVHWIYAE